MLPDTCHAMVLHRRAYRETSYIVDLFTRERGKVSAVCKGVRNSKGEKKSLLQPFQPLMVTLHGRHELKNLGQMESTGPAYVLAGQAMFSAMYLNEVLNRCLPVDSVSDDVFDLYLATIVRLTKSEPIEEVLREFEISLMVCLGYGIDWIHDWQSGEPVDADAYYAFVALHGFQRMAQPERTNNCFKGSMLRAIHDKSWNKTVLSAAKRVMRMALLPILGEKPLKSRELFLQVEQIK